MTNDAAAGGRRNTAIQIFGWVGLGLSLVLAIGILLGRSWAAEQVDGVFDSVDQAVGRGTTIVAATNGRLQERVADIDALLAEVSSIAGNVSVPPSLAEKASGIADRFSQIRDGWVAVRARIDAALETLAQLDRALPFIDLPTGPTEELAALDQRVAEIDANVARLRSSVSTTVQAIADGATGLRGVVNGVAEVADRLETGLGAVQDRIDRARSTIDNVMWLTTAMLLLLVAYVAFLNVIIIRQARRRPSVAEGPSQLPAAASSPAAAAASSPPPAEDPSPTSAEEVPSPPPADAT